MPKLSRRKRQLKELHVTRKGEDGEDGSDEVDSEPETATRQMSQQSAMSNGTSTSTQKQTRARKNATNATVKTTEEERIWVQCNTCDKWRSLPPTVDASKLPDIWVCSLNIYDEALNNCDAPEESYKQDEEDVNLKSFLKLWAKKLKNADRAENCLPSSAVTRGRKRKLDSEWIQCNNPSCGKWRSVSRGIETAALVRRLNKGKSFGTGEWFCSMNSWDDTTASCAAPQEPLWNCRWNLTSVEC